MPTDLLARVIPWGSYLKAVAPNAGLGYRGDMGWGLRRFFVALVALAFLGSTLERAAFGLTPDDPCPLSGHTHRVAHAALHVAGHEHHGHPSADKQQAPSKHQGTKCFCYGMAGFNVLPFIPVSDVIFLTTPISFSVVFKAYSGRSVILDPGIPKRIA